MKHRAGSLDLRARFALDAPRSALFGPSGAGKTTLLRILAGLEQPDTGRVARAGRTLTDTETGLRIRPGPERAVGLVAQSPALFPHLSVEQNIAFGIRAMPREAQRVRMAELIALLALEPLRTRQPATLSGGEKQRVALARALAPQPRLLLLDEPFSALGSDRKAQLWSTLDRYLDEHRIATLLVSHDAGEVWARAHSVVRIAEGIAEEQGTPEQMLAEEREALLRQFELRST